MPSGTALGHHGNHARKQGGDNHWPQPSANLVVDFCHCAHLGERVESDSGLTPGQAKVMDVLVLNWERGP